MTLPRVPGSGLSTATAHTVFPEDAREDVRSVTPWEDAWHNVAVESREGGATRTTYEASPDSPVQARIDSAGGSGTQRMSGDIMHEDTTHIITFRIPRAVSSADRISIHGYDWDITGVKRESDEPVTQVEVQQA